MRSSADWGPTFPPCYAANRSGLKKLIASLEAIGLSGSHSMAVSEAVC